MKSLMLLGHVAVLSFLLPCGTSFSASLPDPRSAEQVCGRLAGDSLKEECYHLIRDAVFEPRAAGECDGYKSSKETLECMKIIRDNFFDSDALAVCHVFPDASLTNVCLEVIASRFMQDDAVAACDEITGVQGNIDCFRAIVDKKFSDREVRECRSMTTAKGTTICFQNRGVAWNKVSQVQHTVDQLSTMNLPSQSRSPESQVSEFTVKKLKSFDGHQTSPDVMDKVAGAAISSSAL